MSFHKHQLRFLITMPIYEYYCTQCQQSFELLQKRDDPQPKHCAHCQAPHPDKLVSKGNFHLKGKGWYVTDFKDNKKEDKPKSAQSGASSDDGPSTKTDHSTKSTSESTSNTSTTTDKTTTTTKKAETPGGKK